ncbi:hypothetical protein TeGR_g11760 [Tetraparma gracilis]|uniref:Uncharacterized protein n=1 Tax=Tetraparma gracilis TaxID=2962635 RepID=A0ABQ6MM72_9STRA|nr:hypothetical protein TeGR_g11760 [Tetraparma gracilis]
MLGGAVTDSILLKVPQLIWCGAMFFMASTWKMLHDQSANMKKANPKEQEKLDRICNYVNIGMICIVVPAYIVGNVLGVAILNTFVNLFQTATIMFLIVAAIFFGTKLAKELGDEGPGAALGKVIKKSMWIAVAGGVVMILAVVANMMGLTKGGGAKTFIFWTCIHFPEYVESRILLEMKISQRKKVVAETKTNKSTMSTTTSSADP